MNLSEKEIIEKILKGETELFELIVNNYKNQLYSFLFRMCFNEAVCEEVLQQAFLKAYKYLEKCDSEKGLKNWLYQITRNCYFDFLRKEKKINMVSMEDFKFFLSSEVSGPEETVISRDECHTVLKSIYSLKPKYSEVMILRYVEEKSYEEISQILNIPIGTVKIRIHRGREKVRQAMEDNSGEMR